MVRKPLIKQTLLCLALGPLGLATESIQYAITGTLITIALLLVFTEYMVWIWFVCIIASASVGVLLIRARFKREEIDKFQLSTFVGTVSCKVVAKGPVDRSYRKILKKIKFRRKVGYSINIALGLVCILLVVAIAAPDFFSKIELNKVAEEKFAATGLTEKEQQQSYEVAPLFSNYNDGRYTVRSTNILSGHSGPYRAVLELECRQNNTFLAIRSTDILGTERSTVTIGVNESFAQQSNWQILDDFHAAVSPQPVDMLLKMQNQSQVRIQFQPYDSPYIRQAYFDGEMIKTAITGVRRQCHW